MYLDVPGFTMSAGAGSRGFFIADLPGWGDSPTPVIDLKNRPNSNGSFSPGEVFFGPKTFSVEGSYWGETVVQASEAKRQLVALAASGRSFPLTVTEETGTRTMMVWIASRVGVPAALFDPYFKFDFDVVAVDPRKYGPTVIQSTGLPVAAGGLSWPLVWPINWGAVGSRSRVTNTNTGTTDAHEQFTITGGLLNGFTLTQIGTDREISYDGSIPEGSYVTVDSRTGAVLINGESDRSGLLVKSDWWSIPPGGTSTVRFTARGASLGNPTLTVRFAPADI